MFGFPPMIGDVGHPSLSSRGSIPIPNARSMWSVNAAGAAYETGRSYASSIRLAVSVMVDVGTDNHSA
jgi:hypothetical protein